MKKLLLIVTVAVVAGIGWFVWQKQSQPGESYVVSGAASFNKQQYSLDDPKSIWIVANKQRQLKPASYAPDDLITPDVALRLSADADEMKMRKEAGHALESLFAAARQDDIRLQISSAYRSYSYQKNLYNHYVEVQGREVADSQSARPGYSEHQTGLAVDVEPDSRKCEVEQCFADTPEGQWVAANAYKFGFIIRYPKDMQQVTGYIYEPWHIRYVGKKLAAQMHSQNVPTLEEFFGLGKAADY